MTSRTSGGGLFLRHLRFGAAGAPLLAVFILMAGFLLAALPGALDHIGAAELRYRAADLSPNVRYPTAQVLQPPPFGSPEDLWKPLTNELAGVRAGAPALLQQHLGAARFTIFTDLVDLPRPPKDYPVSGTFRLALAADPRQKESMVLVSGTWPAPISQAAADHTPIGIVLSMATAKRLAWTIGQIKKPVLGQDSGVSVVLTGIFTDAPGSADYWTLNRSILVPAVKHTLDSDIITATGFLDPNSWPASAAVAPMAALRIYYPLSVQGVQRSGIDPLRADIEQFTNGVKSLRAPTGSAGTSTTGSPTASTSTATATEIRLSSQLPATLASVAATIASARSVLSILAIGPGGAALSVLTLATGLLALRRRRSSELLSTRGASALQLRTLLGVEGLLLAVPSAAIGVTVAMLTLPPDDVGSALLLPSLAVLLPVGLLAASATTRRSGRADLTNSSLGRRRGIVELLLLLAAAVSTVLLYRSGVRVGPDPLVVAAPLLLCLAAAAVVLRLFPVPMLLLQRLFRRRRGLINFLGSSRSTRESTVGFAPILALVIGVAIAVLSAVLLTTLRQGVTGASVSQIGADLRIDLPDMSQQDAERVAAVSGVAAVASQYTLGGVPIRVAGIEQGIQVYLVDTAALSVVQQGVPGAVALVPGMGERQAGAIPVVTSPGLADAGPLTVGGDALRVVGSSAITAGLGSSTRWVLADRAFLTQFGATVYSPETFFVHLTRAADPAVVAGALPDVIDQAAVRTSGQLSARLLASPIVGGFQAVVLVALSIMGLLCAVAVLMTAIAGAPGRRRLLGILRILGLPPVAARALVAWELAPIAIAALLGGGAVGTGLGVVVTDVVDLRPFTGGAVQPALLITVPVLSTLAGGLVVVVAAAIAVSAAVAQRAGFTAVLRFGEE